MYLMPLLYYPMYDRSILLMSSWYVRFSCEQIDLCLSVATSNHQVPQIRDQEDKQAAKPSLIFHEILFYTPKCGSFL